MWREPKPFWMYILYGTIPVILVIGVLLIWPAISPMVFPPAMPTAVLLTPFPTNTEPTHTLVPTSTWQTPTPRPKKPTWTPFSTSTGVATRTPTLRMTLTPTITLTPTKAKTRTRTIAPTSNPSLNNQTITFTGLPGMTYGNPDFTVSAMADSGLTVSFSTSGNCSNSNSTISITGAGSCTVTASQPGNASFNPAPAVSQTFSISKATPSCSFTGYNVSYDGQPHTADGSCTGLLGVTLALNLGSTTHTAGGDYNDTCDFSNSTDNNNYFKGTVHDLITPINQNITFDPLSPKIFGDPPFDVSASASSGLPVTFDSSGDCTNSGSTITLTAEGTCTVIATQGGNSSYNPAAEVDQAFDINAP